jgi:hypothetical protein
MVIGSLSPRSTAPNRTLTRSPSVTSPMIVALSATKQDAGITGFLSPSW